MALFMWVSGTMKSVPCEVGQYEKQIGEGILWNSHFL